VHTHKVARACLGIHSGVGDFRWGTGAVNMGVGFISDVQLAGFVTFVGNHELMEKIEQTTWMMYNLEFVIMCPYGMVLSIR
jgi:hypothetical protein